MKNIYHRDIVEILLECGRSGLRIKNIARRIYNRHANLFEADICYEQLRDSVGKYLWEQNLRPESPFHRTRYGTYAIKADFAIQLDLFLDIAPRSEAHREAPKSATGPRYLQMELF